MISGSGKEWKRNNTRNSFFFFCKKGVGGIKYIVHCQVENRSFGEG